MVEQELRSDLPMIELDRDQMKQAFYNVIKNSFEAMKRRGILRIRTDMDASACYSSASRIRAVACPPKA